MRTKPRDAFEHVIIILCRQICKDGQIRYLIIKWRSDASNLLKGKESFPSGKKRPRQTEANAAVRIMHQVLGVRFRVTDLFDFNHRYGKTEDGGRRTVISWFVGGELCDPRQIVRISPDSDMVAGSEAWVTPAKLLEMMGDREHFGDTNVPQPVLIALAQDIAANNRLNPTPVG